MILFLLLITTAHAQQGNLYYYENRDNYYGQALNTANWKNREAAPDTKVQERIDANKQESVKWKGEMEKIKKSELSLEGAPALNAVDILWTRHKYNIARKLGLLTKDEYELSYSLGEEEDGHLFRQISNDLIDLGVGIDPITGMGRSFFELFTGKNFVTGEILTPLDRGLHAATILSFGTLSTSAKIIKIAGKSAHLGRIKTALGSAIKFLRKNDQLIETAVKRDEEILKRLSATAKNHEWINPKTGHKLDKRSFETVEFYD